MFRHLHVLSDIFITETRYDYNLTIMKSPKPATENSLNEHFALWQILSLIFCVLWWLFWKWRPVEILQCRESIRDIIIYPHIKFWWYRTMLNCYPPFLCRVLAAILKMADILKILKTQNCSSKVTYHNAKFYVSIIIQLRSYQH